MDPDFVYKRSGKGMMLIPQNPIAMAFLNGKMSQKDEALRLGYALFTRTYGNQAVGRLKGEGFSVVDGNGKAI